MSLRSAFRMCASFGAALLLMAGSAHAASFTAIYAFGDSLSDAGNVYAATGHAEPISPPYASGRFSNGPLWVQDLALGLGLTRVVPDLLGGTDFAVGGAETGATRVHQVNVTDLPSQLALFRLKIGVPKPRALYTLWIGSNDLFDILAAPNLTLNQRKAAANEAVANVVAFAGAIAANGARQLLVLDVPDLGMTPRIRALGPIAQADASALAAYFNQGLATALTTAAPLLGLTLHFVDTYAAIDAAVANPATYGFTDAVNPCWTGSYTSRSGSLCSVSRAAENDYLFWDHVHPTARGHALIAASVLKALTGVAIAAIP